MKKFSKLNESVRLNQSKIDSLLSELKNVSYEIFDYYLLTKKIQTTKGSYDSKTFEEDLSRIKPGAKNSKIILIRPEIGTESVNIDKWYENFKINSSGFYFFNNLNDAKNQYNQIFELVEKLKEYSASLCIRDNIFIITLIGDEVSQGDLNVQKDLVVAYDKLYKLLTTYSNKNEDKISDVTFWREYNDLSMKLDGDDEEICTVLASLCPHMSKKSDGYKWIIDQPKDDELQNIADSINEMGFLIEFVGLRDSNYKLKLVEM